MGGSELNCRVQDYYFAKLGDNYGSRKTFWWLWCGAVRYETIGKPNRTTICHCRYCQTRTGSAVEIGCYFNEENVVLLSCELKEYKFTNNSNRWFINKFCSVCGTTVLWTVELREGWIGVAGSTFDPPFFWYEPDVEIFCRTKGSFIDTNIVEKHSTTEYYGNHEPDRLGLTRGS